MDGFTYLFTKQADGDILMEFIPDAPQSPAFSWVVTPHVAREIAGSLNGAADTEVPA